MNASELFVKCLEAEGVTHIFGVPGEENAHFLMALENSPIQFVLCRHEQGAAFIADVYGRLTGKPGVCLGTLGPGATNLVTGVADANMDRSPLIAITGQADSMRQHKESHQHMDVVGMFRPITKWAQPIINPNNIPEVIRKAFKLAAMEKPGACHIELADDIAAVQVDELKPIPWKKTRRAVPDDKVVDEAVALIQKAKRPIIIAGNGAVRKQASDQLRRLCETTGIGVISTFMGKGAVSMDAPYCLYTIGLQSRDYGWLAVDQADLIITLGYDLVEYHPRLWNRDHCDAHERKIIHIDYLAAEVDADYQVDVEIVGDLAHTLWMISEKINMAVTSYDFTGQKAMRDEMWSEISEHKDAVQTGLITPQKVLWEVRKALGPDDILLSDVGAHKMWVARYFHAYQPNTCLISNGFCSMGFALPGAIGAKIVHPNKKIIAVCGDGGFLMNVQELETARRLNLPVVIMVWDDSEYGLIAWKQDNSFGRHTDLAFNNPDFVKLAEAFDCIGINVTDSNDLPEALEKAFKADKPVIMRIPIDYRENKKLTSRLGDIECVL